jgi:hypothetical protein
MADLTGTTPANTYKGLLQVNDYTDGIAGNTGSNALAIQDGAGNSTALAVSTDRVGIGTTSPIGKFEVTGGLSYLEGVSLKPASGTVSELNSGSNSFDLLIKNGNTETLRVAPSGSVTPGADGTQDLGSSSKRWNDIYATNTTIQSSDRELKQDIEELSEAETRVAQACKGLLRKYRWKSSVEEKGDEARIHFGIMAQDLEAAFAAEGLDAGRYGMFVKNTWWTADRVIPAVETVEAQPEKTVTDTFNNIEDAPEGATEVTERGVRYSELLAFIIAAI